MKLKSFGCSFVYGTDLSDCDSRGRPVGHSRRTWPALLAQHYGLDYECQARPGAGNLQIAESVLKQIHTPALFVINWTWIDRFDYNKNKQNTWETIRPVDTDPVATTYYRDIHSQYRDKLTNLMAIYTVVTELKARNRPFIMTYMDELLWEREWHAGAAVELLQAATQPAMGTFESLTFLEWAKKRGYPISPDLHPTDVAHQRAYELAVNHGWLAGLL